MASATSYFTLVIDTVGVKSGPFAMVDWYDVTTGQYDVVVTLDMPNGEAMAKFAMAIAASGNARTTTVRAFPVEEFAKLAADAPSF